MVGNKGYKLIDKKGCNSIGKWVFEFRTKMEKLFDKQYEMMDDNLESKITLHEIHEEIKDCFYLFMSEVFKIIENEKGL